MTVLGKKTMRYAVAMVALYVLLFLFVDGPADLWVRDSFTGTWVSDLGEFFSTLAQGEAIRLGLALAFILILVVDPDTEKSWTRTLLFVCLSCAIALVVGEGLKYLLARHRPVMLFEQDMYGLSFFSSEWEQNSSPSGHTLRAFAILTALALRFRRGRPFFITLGILIGLSRVVVTDHYPSDVLFGAFIGVFSAAWVYRYFFGRRKLPPGGSHQGDQ
jgi:membrane-associated phospholipid phosphatase